MYVAGRKVTAGTLRSIGHD